MPPERTLDHGHLADLHSDVSECDRSLRVANGHDSRRSLVEPPAGVMDGVARADRVGGIVLRRELREVGLRSSDGFSHGGVERQVQRELSRLPRRVRTFLPQSLRQRRRESSMRIRARKLQRVSR